MSSLFGALDTAVSGLTAQSSAFGNISDNIANKVEPNCNCVLPRAGVGYWPSPSARSGFHRSSARHRR